MAERRLKRPQREAAPARNRGASRTVTVGSAANDNRVPPRILLVRAIIAVTATTAIAVVLSRLLG